MTIPIPRIQGRAIEKDGGWTFEFIFSFLGEETGDMYGCNTIYSTKDEAIKHLKKAVQDCIKCFAECFPDLNVCDRTYIDMKTNATRRWDKKDEN
jgi:hypothetical protein